MRKVLLLNLLSFVLCAPILSADASQPSPEPIGPVNLRGYGEIAASISYSMAADGSEVSLTVVECESPEKARLLHTKYLSDLQVLPGVGETTVAIGGQPRAAVEPKDQGLIIAAQRGTTVVILAAETAAGLQRAAAEALPRPDTWSFKSAATVPAFLDKWDRYGFGFWLQANKEPQEDPGMYKDESVPIQQTAPYDHDQYFRYCKQYGLSVVLPFTTMRHDCAAGLFNFPWMAWSVMAVDKNRVPAEISVVYDDLLQGTTWWANRYRGETMQKMPGYCGSYYMPGDWYHGGTGAVSWCSERGRDAMMAVEQQFVRRYSEEPMLRGHLEPCSEIRHTAADLLLEYGPVADASYQRFLKEVRGLDLAGLNRRWGTNFTSWDQVRVPELVSFFGWDDQALDLGGTWKVKYGTREEGEQGEWYAPETDVAAWPEIVAPGHDRLMFLPEKGGWWRRSFEAPADWMSRHGGGPVYLYCFDLNPRDQKQSVPVYFNGQLVVEDTPTPQGWFNAGILITEVTKFLKPGSNTLVIYLPPVGHTRGICYKVYLAAHQPVEYPNLGREGNARWVDFRDWHAWTSAEGVRRGLEMIRGAEPNAPIKLMAPYDIVDLEKPLLQQYGAFYHDTGGVSGNYMDYLARMANSLGVPSSAEPGNFPANANDAKAFVWRCAQDALCLLSAREPSLLPNPG